MPFNHKFAALQCLNCQIPLCKNNGCPVKADIPDFIKAVRDGDNAKAYQILQEKNVFSAICALICPQDVQCEGSCVRGIKGQPVEIGKLENYVNEWAAANAEPYQPTVAEAKRGKTVAVVGGGPAGLEAAFELLRFGFDVTIFERNAKLGGIMSYGIPEFRLDRAIVDQIADRIVGLGAKVELNSSVDLAALGEQFDAVVLAVGAQIMTEQDLDVPAETPGLWRADHFLKAFADHQSFDKLGDVVIIGGGNVAMDCSRVALRAGAKTSTILYRRGPEQLPAQPIELEEALEDGVKVQYWTRVESANVSKTLSSLNTVRTELTPEGRVVDIPSSNSKVKADSVIFAIGAVLNLAPLAGLIENGLTFAESGLVEVNEVGRTNLSNVWAAGDLVEPKSTVCRAIASGRRAAFDIIEHFNELG